MPSETERLPQQTAGNGTTNTTGGAAGGGGGPGPPGGGSGGGPNTGGDGIGPSVDLPDPGNIAEGVVQWFVGSLMDGAMFLLEKFNTHLLTLPAAGDPGSPATWFVTPGQFSTLEDPFWMGVGVVYVMLAAFVLPLIWGVGWFNIGYPRGAGRTKRLKDLVLGVVLVLWGWPMVQLWLHFWNEATLAFAPSGGEFFADPEGIAKLGLGVVLAAIILIYKAALIIVALGLHLFFVLLTFITVAMWPLFVALFLTDIFAISTVGKAGIAATLILGPIQFIKSVVLRLVFEFPLDPSQPESVITVFFILAGVTTAFFIIPWFGLKRLLPRSIMSMGRQHVGDQERFERLTERAPSGRELTERVREVSTPSAGARLGGRDGADGDGNLRTRVSSALGSRGGGGGLSSGAQDTRSRTGSASSSAALSEDWRQLRRSASSGAGASREGNQDE